MDLNPLCELMGSAIPLDCMKYRFMQHAMLGLLLLAPMVSTMGVQVVNARMAFFSDAIGHSSFAGVAVGLLLSVDPKWSMPVIGIMVGLLIMLIQRRSRLSVDVAIGVSLSAVVAFGLAMVSRDRNLARNINSFLFGDILSLDDGDLLLLAGLFALLMLFQFFSSNRLTLIAMNPTLAKTHGCNVRAYSYVQAAMLSTLVIFSVRVVGVFLVTALLVVPAATARNLSASAKAMFWWSLAISVCSVMAGLMISAQKWAQLATGATIVLVSCALFCISCSLRKVVRD